MYREVLRALHSLALCVLILLAARLQGIVFDILMELQQCPK